MKELETLGADVVYHDPFVGEVRDDGRVWRSEPLTDALMHSADAIVIVTDHSEFDVDRIVEHARVLVDARNATAGLESPGEGVTPGQWIVKGV